MVCFVLIGSTAFFVFHFLNQFNKALDNLTASTFTIAKIPPVSLSNKTNKAPIPASAPETTPTPATSAESTDLRLSFIFPKENSEVYIGCTYQLSFQSSATIRLLETALIDAGSRDAIEPDASGLAVENKIGPNSQSLDWKVIPIWPGEYYIGVSKINGVDLESRSDVFTIRKMPKDISVGEKGKICKESGGSF